MESYDSAIIVISEVTDLDEPLDSVTSVITEIPTDDLGAIDRNLLVDRAKELLKGKKYTLELDESYLSWGLSGSRFQLLIAVGGGVGTPVLTHLASELLHSLTGEALKNPNRKPVSSSALEQGLRIRIEHVLGRPLDIFSSSTGSDNKKILQMADAKGNIFTVEASENRQTIILRPGGATSEHQ